MDPFQLNEEIVKRRNIRCISRNSYSINSDTIFEFGEAITNLEGDTAYVEETNVDTDGNVTDRLVVSKTSVLQDLKLEYMT